MIIANTKKGRGAPLMEDKRLWHYRVPGGEDLAQVLKDLGEDQAAVPLPAGAQTGSY